MPPRGGRVDEVGRQAHLGRIVERLFGPGHMGPPVPDEQAERTVGRAQLEELGDALGELDTGPGVVVEAVFRLVGAVRHLAERGDLVAEAFQRRGQVGGARFRVRVIGFRAVPGGHQSGQQRGAARRASGRSHKGVVEGHPGRRQAFEVGRPNVRGPVDGRIQPAEVVGQIKDDVGRGGGQRAGDERERSEAERRHRRFPFQGEQCAGGSLAESDAPARSGPLRSILPVRRQTGLTSQPRRCRNRSCHSVEPG